MVIANLSDHTDNTHNSVGAVYQAVDVVRHLDRVPEHRLARNCR